MGQKLTLHVGAEKEAVKACYQAPQEHISSKRSETLAIMIHGFPDRYANANQDLFPDLEFMFSSQGVHSLRFDFRGCGQSEGEESAFTLARAKEDFRAILDWADKQQFRHLLLVAEGLGAVTALQNMPDSADLLLLFWPVLDTKTYAMDQLGAQDFEDAGQDIVLGRTDEGGKAPQTLTQELLMTDLGPAIKSVTVPTLVQHGAQDITVPAANLDLLRQNAQTSRLDITVYQDGRHALSDERHRKMVFFHVGQFLERYA